MDSIVGTIHKGLTVEKWASGGLDNMLGNIGSETHRALEAKKKGQQDRFLSALARALELTDLTSLAILQSDKPYRAKEVGLLREIIADAYLGGEEYPDGLEYADRYCMEFALRAQKEFIANHS